MTETTTPITDYISTREASKRSGLTQSHIGILLARGILQGQKVARDWMVYAPSLDAYLANRPKRGPRPKKS